MRRIGTLGVCLAAVLAMSAMIVAPAHAEAPEWGQCMKLGKYTTPKEKKGFYKDANCTEYQFKEKGEELQGKGNYEWRPGPPPTCQKMAGAKFKYADPKCEHLHMKVKTKKGVPTETPDNKGEYEKYGGFDNGPGFVAQGSANSVLHTPALAGPIVCKTLTATGEIISAKEVSAVATFTGCETAGKKCNSRGGGIPGTITTLPLIGKLYESFPAIIGNDYYNSEAVETEEEVTIKNKEGHTETVKTKVRRRNKEGKLVFSSEIDCEGILTRTSNGVGGHVTSGFETMGTSSTELLDNTAASEQDLSTEVSLGGWEGPWVGPYPSLEETTFTTTYRFADRFMVKGEWRYDWSNQPFFYTSRLDDLRKSQLTATLGLIWWYGGKQGPW